MQTAQNDSGFDQIISHNLKQASAPAEIVLPKELVEGLQNAWDNSFPDGKSQEQGGILVRHKDNSYQWKAGKGTESSSFTINYEDINQDETLVFTGHTHPYDENEGGTVIIRQEPIPLGATPASHVKSPDLVLAASQVWLGLGQVWLAANEIEGAILCAKAGLEEVGADYRPLYVEDDTELKLLLAEKRIKKGHLKDGANMMLRVLHNRIVLYDKRHQKSLLAL